jgi:flagellar biosynthesis/type III secretory pathway protein FliH
MAQALTVSLDKPIVATELLDGPVQNRDNLSPTRAAVDSVAQAGAPTEGSEAQRTAFSQACQTLNGVIDRLNEMYAKIFAEHGEEIARLSVEIARKVLMQKVDKGDYEIESIIKEALMHAPSRQDLVVHVNPDDLTQFRKVQQQDKQGSALRGVELVPDPNIGRAECLIESPKGIIKSLIDENLDRIGRALTKEY